MYLLVLAYKPVHYLISILNFLSSSKTVDMPGKAHVKPVSRTMCLLCWGYLLDKRCCMAMACRMCVREDGVNNFESDQLLLALPLS